MRIVRMLSKNDLHGFMVILFFGKRTSLSPQFA